MARETKNFEPTIDIDTTQVRFLGNLSLMLWDCGGQEAYIESFFASQQDHLFHNVAVLIFVFDVESKKPKKEITYFRNCVEALLKHSPEARIFCLVHKMDLLPEDRGDVVFRKKRGEYEKIAHPLKVQCFKTSIWDETLYKAWSQIVYSMIPNVQTLERTLHKFCAMCEADEMVIFERSTFLVISHASSKSHTDVHRFEKISNIIKQFKLSCSKMGTEFSSMQVKNKQFSGFVDALTQNAYILVTLSDPAITAPAVNANIREARKFFAPILESPEMNNQSAASSTN